MPTGLHWLQGWEEEWRDVGWGSVSQHTDTKATLKCGYALRSYVGTICRKFGPKLVSHYKPVKNEA